MYDIIITILAIIGVFGLVALYYALKRITQYETFIITIQQVIEFATEHMKKVDADGHYESDDETGFFFEQLKELQVLFNEIFETEKESNAKKNKEKK